MILSALLALSPQPAINNEYIVIFNDYESTADVEMLGEVVQRFDTINGALIKPFNVENLKADPRIIHIEKNQPMYMLEEMSIEQDKATWGIDRVDQRNLPLDSQYNFIQGTTVVHSYIVDTGIKPHNDFTGRLGNGFSAMANDPSTVDCQGHGSHVAGTVGGTTYGIAKNTILHPVRVLDCSGSGTTAGVIAGIDWVTKNAIKPAVANMSLGGGFSASLNLAMKKSIEAGISYAVAAGNESTDACTKSPASEPLAVTVGAVDKSDRMSYFSNFGTCVDVFAPGSSITSVGISSVSSTKTMSGTSMASPHVAGAIAVYLSLNPNSTSEEVSMWVEKSATQGILFGIPEDTVNKNLFIELEQPKKKRKWWQWLMGWKQ